MEDDRRPDVERIQAVEIDYRNLDVAGIMDQVKAIAASRPLPPGREEAPETAPGGPASPDVPPPAPPPGLKARLKAKALKAMAPFFPVIRFFALPLHEEIQAVTKQLDATNRRIDFLYGRLRDLDRSMEYIKLLHNLGHNLVVEMTKLKIEEETVRGQAQVLEKDLAFLARREKALEKKTAG